LEQRQEYGMVAPGGGSAVAPERYGDRELGREERNVRDVRIQERYVSVRVLAMLQQFKMKNLFFRIDGLRRLERPVLVAGAEDINRAQDHASMMMDGFRREAGIAVG